MLPPEIFDSRRFFCQILWVVATICAMTKKGGTAGIMARPFGDGPFLFSSAFATRDSRHRALMGGEC
jgi:hypothetical protein